MARSTRDTDKVIPARSLYHRTYWSHRGGYDPDNSMVRYWKVCYGYMRPFALHELVVAAEAERRGLRRCSRCWLGSNPE